MHSTRVGAFDVHRLTEFEGPFIAPEVFFPDFDPEVLRAHPEMAGPRLIDPASGKLVFSFHCFIVRTGRQRTFRRRPQDASSGGGTLTATRSGSHRSSGEKA